MRIVWTEKGVKTGQTGVGAACLQLAEFRAQPSALKSPLTVIVAARLPRLEVRTPPL